MAEHSTLTGASLHETKGAASASANTVHQADGAGNTSWAKVGTSNINTSSIKEINKRCLTFVINDINAAADYFIVSPWAGVISKAYSVIDSALATADNTLTLSIAGVAVTNGVITITQSGSAIGDVDSCTPTAARTVTAGQAIKIANNGGTSSTTRCTLTIEIDVS